MKIKYFYGFEAFTTLLLIHLLSSSLSGFSVGQMTLHWLNGRQQREKGAKKGKLVFEWVEYLVEDFISRILILITRFLSPRSHILYDPLFLSVCGGETYGYYGLWLLCLGYQSVDYELIHKVGLT